MARSCLVVYREEVLGLKGAGSKVCSSPSHIGKVTASYLAALCTRYGKKDTKGVAQTEI